MRRIVKRVKQEGDEGVIHQLRGKHSNRELPKKIKEKVIKLYRQKYYDFGPTFANEKLFEDDKIKISVQTLRNWPMEDDLWRVSRKYKKYRQWRERKHYFGEMVQLDDSHHSWFEEREGLNVCLKVILTMLQVINTAGSMNMKAQCLLLTVLSVI